MPPCPDVTQRRVAVAYAHFVAGRYTDAEQVTDRMMTNSAAVAPWLRVKIASCGLLGRHDEGRKWVKRLLEIEPAARFPAEGVLGGAIAAKSKRPAAISRRRASVRPAGGHTGINPRARAPSSAPGTKRLIEVGQSMSALPGYFRRQLVPLSRGHHPPQCQDI
jgi:hypothetical protein